MENKVCTFCNINKNISDYYFSKFFNIYYARCKQCHNSSVYDRYKKTRRKYLESDSGKKAINDASSKARIVHKIKWEARAKLRYEVKKGTIIKPVYCQSCLTENVNIQGHHDDYTKPLDVFWLCTRCHADRHKYLKEINN